MPKQSPTTVSRKISLEQVRATASRRRGVTVRANTSTAATIPNALPRAQASSPAPLSSPPSIGTSSTIATTARSWKMRNETATRPVGVVDVRRSASIFNTMAVELSETRRPVNTAVRHSTSAASRIPVTMPVLRPTWMAPPPRIRPASWRRRVRLNSMPMVNSSRTTPMSADWFTRSRSSMRASPFGPMTAPLRRKPMMGTVPIRTET